ncbi:MAG: sulfur oxidation c-type cytochrome SoxA [Burkholderiales bacterium]|nr:sulfur oxidation c-type cytochrome SoxA [Burkholderiales bacterium]
MRPAFAVLAAFAAAMVMPSAAQTAAVADLFIRADKGHCIACHQVPSGSGPRTRSDVGPRLEGGRMRSLGRPAIRAAIVDPMAANPDTVMPPFGRHRVLDMAEIERLVEYLHALPASTPGPAAQAQSPEDAARGEAESHAGDVAAVLETGKRLWNTKFKDGRTMASCFPNGGRGIAATYPLYDARLKKVVALETAVNQCRKTHGEALLDATDAATMGAVVAYVRSLSNGQKIALRIPPAAKERLEQGRRLYYTRLGQRNYACASCHVRNAGRTFNDAVLSPAAGQAAQWPLIREAGAVTAQARMRECLQLMGAAPFAAGSDELNHLEYYLTSLSNGMAIKANAWRSK